MEFKHVSVLLEECIENLNIKPDGIYVDGTLGGGGHASYICQHLSPEGTLIGIDRDQDALNAASERLKDYPCQKIFVQSNYSDIRNVLEELELDGIDGALLDLGVSSFQLDNAERGFSYMHDAPLDMRMNQDDSFTAYDVVNEYDQKELTRIISKYGEEKWASRVATFIVNGRKDGPIETTGQLVELIKAAIPAKARREGPHPAKRTFQAIRIEVNDELGQLEHAIEDDGFKSIQFQLSCFRCHGNGHIITDNIKSHLVYHFRDNRVYLTRHNGRTILLCRQIDLTETGFGSGRHQSQVIGNLGQCYRTGFDGTGNCHKRIQVLCGVD